MKERKKPRLLKPIEPLTDDQLDQLIKALRLNKTQARNLCIALLHARQDIDTRNKLLSERPDDDAIRRSYKDFDKALNQLQNAIDAHGDKGTYCLPHDSLAALSMLLSDRALQTATRREAMALGISERNALGLNHGPQLLAYVVDQLRSPLQQWLEDDHANKGGRPGGTSREILVAALAEHAESIIGKRASASPTSDFVRLSEEVLRACQLSTAGLEKMIERTIQKLRARLRPPSPPRKSRNAP
jgi:hypothetical protein